MQTEGSYGRIIAVITCNGFNLNEELLDVNLGHIPSGFCSASEFSNDSWAQKHGCISNSEPEVSVPIPQTQNYCDPSYPDFCIPSSLPDLNCKDIPQKKFSLTTRSTWI